ncbi:methionine--tRNA ligase [Candidatus Shikimatogenerans bostrichidophilus]|uniref:methionine--tRNA ligase n=1 Tax=Candidatus Shikimatogenerans bostrichidophilus TaxID=2943807 RepID=UPI00296712F4
MRYIITAAFPYTNGYIHIGHLSGVYIPSDIYYRNLILNNKKKVIFVSGSDEHGSSILIKSLKENKSIKSIINKYHNYNNKFLKKFNIKLNIYYRTTNKNHHILVKKIFKKLLIKKMLKKKKSYEYYDKYYKQFLSDRYVIGLCPYCNYKYSYSDQCEKCGNIIKEGKLLNPISILSKNKPIFKKTINYFINIKKNKKLINNYLKYLINNKNNKNNVINNIKYYLNNLKNRSITRDLKWGVKLPINKYKNKYNNKVIYVWFDALIGYLSSSIEYCVKNKIKWYKYWKNKNTKLITFIGKDNLYFHSILLPIIYKNYNNNLIIPNHIQSNNYLNLEGKKISTSKNWTINLHEILNVFPNMQDSIRYSLIMDMPENKDTNFTFKKFKLYNNSILIGILGNFINRSIVLLKKKSNGIILTPFKIKKKDNKILNKISKYPIKIYKLIKNFKFRDSICKFINLSRIGNKYLSHKKPWCINNIKKFNYIMYIVFKIIIMITYLSYIFLPNTNKKLLKILNLNIKEIKNIILNKKDINNHKINKNKIIFNKIYKKDINKIIKILKKRG